MKPRKIVDLPDYEGMTAPDASTWERVACTYCGQHHEPGTTCPPLEFPGTEWDQ